jgi:hypothetical protein
MRSARLPRLYHPGLRRAIIQNIPVEIARVGGTKRGCFRFGIIYSCNFYIFIGGTFYTFFGGTLYIGLIGDGTFFGGLFYFGFITYIIKHTTKFDCGRDPAEHRACHRRLRDHR